MKNLSRYLLLGTILFAIYSVAIPNARAFSISSNPFTFVAKVTDSFMQKVSDVVYYLVRQKEYLFNEYKDPNVYTEVTSLGNIVEETEIKSEDKKVVNSGSPIVVETPKIPEVKATVRVPDPSVIVFPPIILPKSAEPIKVGSETTNDYDSSGILTSTNKERKTKSLSPLSGNKVLDKVALQRVRDLFTNQYFDHQSPDGKSAPDLAKKEGYSYLIIGENLALGNFGSDSAIVSAWMDSPGHRANILNPKFKELGVAQDSGKFEGREVTIAVQIFGQSQASCFKPNIETKNSINVSTQSINKAEAQAKLAYDYLLSVKNDPNLDLSYYNQKIQEYNYYAKSVNEAAITLKKTIDIYNNQINQYNTCIGN